MTLSVSRANTVLSEKVAEQVIQYIRSNQLACGDKLPNEKELEKSLGVGRSTIREAMRALRSRGIVFIRQGSGTYVADAMGVSEDPLGLAFRYDRNRTLANLLDIRFMIEPSTAAACAGRASVAQKQEIRRIANEAAEQIRRGEDHAALDVEMHCKIAKYADNELVNVLFPDILEGISQYIGLLNGAILENTIIRHDEIVRCILAGDQWGAYRAMIDHLEDNRLIMMEYLKNTGEDADKRDVRWFSRIIHSRYVEAGSEFPGTQGYLQKNQLEKVNRCESSLLHWRRADGDAEHSRTDSPEG